MQRRHRNRSIPDGVIVRIVMAQKFALMLRSDPVILVASRVGETDQIIVRFAPALRYDSHPRHLFGQQVRKIDVHEDIPRPGDGYQLLQDRRRVLLGGAPMDRLPVPGGQAEGDCGNPQQRRLHGRGERAGIGDILAHISAPVHA